jgi:hypothetical protein
VYNHKSSRLNWVRGWSVPEQNFRWTDGHEAEIVFYLPEKKIMLCRGIRLLFNTLGEQRVAMFLNDSLIFDGLLQGIGKELMIETTNFHPSQNRLVFKLPDARQPGNGDPRVLGLALREFEVMIQ